MMRSITEDATTRKRRLAKSADACIKLARELVREAEWDMKQAQARLALRSRVLELLVESETRVTRPAAPRRPGRIRSPRRARRVLGFIERERPGV